MFCVESSLRQLAQFSLHVCSAQRGNCHNDSSKYLTSIMQWAQDAGKWTGIVTTARVTHATPGGSYAHTGHRDWESEVPDGCNAEDVAFQLVHRPPGSNFKVGASERGARISESTADSAA
ncbi:hypothetical protein HPB48_003520 [Haemaphysalis longicornis]|uniref:alkaline phosphatase n=1 Tax=Haemaphysalis longicornis TaxID=44386 RepID=A0A9J6G8V8_HAELO|nr:hypothetical protein HPB48_003520 [Haemaphysalis longicornis]